MSGGRLVAEVLREEGVPFLFTLCGGHISPILVESKRLGIRVIDVRHEATAVFAADAVARLTGVPGVAAVTAGPGVTNTATALKNAQMAQSPLVLLGGATATVLRGRGALQDIPQLPLVRSMVKAAWSVGRVRDLGPVLREAFRVARSGVPGPVFVECPVDVLYPEELVRSWYKAKTEGPPQKSLADRLTGAYLRRHLDRMFAPGGTGATTSAPEVPQPSPSDVRAAARLLARAERPLLVVGSQAVLEPDRAGELAAALGRLGIPLYLGGMARGLLGAGHPLQLRHQRREALRAADLVLLAGFPCDFRLDYGAHVRRSAALITANRSRRELALNRRPTLGVLGDVGSFLRLLAAEGSGPRPGWQEWLGTLRERDVAREAAIAEQAAVPSELVSPLALCREIDAGLPGDSLLVVDGGDFVATAAYTVSPRRPLSWLDPGVFGTLGVGAGFALGARLCRPEAEVWLIYGDGSVGYSLAEFDTFARHGLSVIAVVGNDASWAQIAREQVEVFGDAVGTELARTAYHEAAAGLGGVGLELCDNAAIATTLAEARKLARAGKAVLINAHLAKTDFRKGSISI